MNADSHQLKRILLAVRSAYDRGENAMAAARALQGHANNDAVATLLSYDLQSGTYVEGRRRDGLLTEKDREIGRFIHPYLPDGASLLEVGCGEATRLAGVSLALEGAAATVMGFDISWSRVNVGRQWLREQSVEGHLFVADLFNIPLAENSIDVVYSCHSLEPNGGREKEAIRECLRVARNAVVLVEPSYELANAEARERMERHGYVKGLRQAAESLGARIAAFQLLKEIGNPLNPSGVLVLEKEGGTRLAPTAVPQWRCPISSAPLCDCGDVFAAPEVGLVYPVVREIPMLRGEHAIVASKLGSE